MADDSILDKTKKMIGIPEEYDVFDINIITDINSTFAKLTQLGIGPAEGFMIEDNTIQWSAYLDGKPYLNLVKSYMYQTVRLAFDPPSTSFAITAIQEQIKEAEFRLSLYGPKTTYGNETPVQQGAPGSYIGDGQWNLTGGLDFPARAQIGDVGIDYITGNVWRKET